MVLAALELGHEYLAITDHSPRLTVANGLSAARLRAQLDQIAALNRAVGPFRVLTGIECDILDDGGLDQDPDLLDQLDVVVASVHSKLRMESGADDAADDRGGEQPAHRRARPLHGPADQAARAGRRASSTRARSSTPAPSTASPWRSTAGPTASTRRTTLLAVAIDAGCDFSIDTDSHAPGQLDWLMAGCARAAQHDLDPARVITTLPVEDLLARTHR